MPLDPEKLTELKRKIDERNAKRDPSMETERALEERRIERGGPRKLGSFKRGGKVKKTGVYKLHKGEKVVKASTAKRPVRKTPTKKPPARRKSPRR